MRVGMWLSVVVGLSGCVAGDIDIPKPEDSDTVETDTDVVAPNNAPVVEDVALAPDPAFTNDALTATATVTDADGDTTTQTYTWYVNDVEVQSDDGDTLDGATFFDKGDTVQVVVTSIDTAEETAEGSSAILTVSNTPPSLDAITVTPSSGQVGDTLTCEATGSDADEDALTVSYAWSNGATGAALTLAATDLPGTTVTCTATLDDGDGGTASATASADVLNTDPVVASVTVTPATAQVGDTLTCEATATDANGDTPTLSYSWSNGATGATTVVQASDTPGTTLTCTATAADANNGTASATASADVLNTDPVVASVTVTPATAQVGDTLTCEATATDANGDTPTLSYSWSNGASGAAYVVQASDTPGTTLTCTATATDANNGTASATASADVLNTDPVMGAVTVTPATAQVGDTLTCDATATDANGDTPTLSYSWSNGASGAAYVVQASDTPGTTLTCTATATDANNGTASATASADVLNTDPVMGAVTVTPATAQVGDTLTCDATATDANGDTPTLAYSWSNGATGATYVVQASDTPGTTLTCTATATDANNGTASATAAADVLNTDPVMGTVTLTPDPATNDDTLTCVASATDDNPGTLTYAYTWSNLSQGFSYLSTTNTLDLMVEAAGPGDQLECTVTVTDTNNGTDQGSASLVLDNRAPDVTVSLTASGAGDRDSTLTCTASASDDDGEVPALTFGWDVAGTPTAATSTSGSTSTLTGAFSAGDTVTCTVTASDNADASDTDSAQLTIANQPPTLDSVTLSPAPVRTNDVLTATVMSADGDDDLLTTTYTWFVNSTEVQSGPNNTLDGSVWFDKNETVSVTATVNDGAGGTATLSSATLTVANTAPGAPTISISPADATDGDDLICSVDIDATDADNDFLTYTFTWLVDGADSGITGDTVSASETNAGEEWTCQVVAGDGDQVGAIASVDVMLLPCSGINHQLFIDDVLVATGQTSSPEGTNIGQPGVGLIATSVTASNAKVDWLDFSGPNDSFYDDFNTPSTISWSSGCIGGVSLGSGTATSTSDWAQIQHIQPISIDAEFTYAARVYWGNTTDRISLVMRDGLASSPGSCGNATEALLYANVSNAIREPGPPNYPAPHIRFGSNNDQDQSYPGTTDIPATVPQPGSGWHTLRWEVSQCATTADADDDNDGFVASEDCDDDDAEVFPFAGDSYGDGVDSDCDGLDCEAANDGSTYFAVCPGSTSQPIAEQLCITAGYDGLGALSTANEDLHVTNLHSLTGLGSDNRYWVGYSDVGTEGVWQWSTAIGGTYTNWLPTEPNGGPAENCALTVASVGQGWGDFNCAATVDSGNRPLGAVCEKRFEADSDSDGYLLSEDCDDTDSLAYDDNGTSEACAALSCKDILDRGYSTGDGTYWIDPDGTGAFEAYCDMTTDGGGWTLNTIIHPANINDIDEADDWFEQDSNPIPLTNNALIMNQTFSNLGAPRWSTYINSHAVTARFTVHAADNLQQTQTWFKDVIPGSFENWFNQDPIASDVCTDVELTQGCTSGRIAKFGQYSGLAYVPGPVTVFEGMLIDGAQNFIHIRTNNDFLAYYSAVCSTTFQSSTWADSYSDHWGNGLKIWLR